MSYSIRRGLMSGHTKGEWRLNGNGVHITHGNVGTCVACAYDPEHPSQLTEECRANARLIAAAPDLLSACELALKRIDPNPDAGTALEEWAAEACYALSAAIAKATGATP